MVQFESALERDCIGFLACYPGFLRIKSWLTIGGIIGRAWLTLRDPRLRLCDGLSLIGSGARSLGLNEAGACRPGRGGAGQGNGGFLGCAFSAAGDPSRHHWVR